MQADSNIHVNKKKLKTFRALVLPKNSRSVSAQGDSKNQSCDHVCSSNQLTKYM